MAPVLLLALLLGLARAIEPQPAVNGTVDVSPSTWTRDLRSMTIASVIVAGAIALAFTVAFADRILTCCRRYECCDSMQSCVACCGGVCERVAPPPGFVSFGGLFSNQAPVTFADIGLGTDSDESWENLDATDVQML